MPKKYGIEGSVDYPKLIITFVTEVLISSEVNIKDLACYYFCQTVAIASGQELEAVLTDLICCHKTVLESFSN